MSKGAVLVTGGCGFLGYHIVCRLEEDKSWSSVHVVSRSPTKNRVKNVHYHTGDILSEDSLKTLISKIRPSAIIHTASPAASGQLGAVDFMRTNVEGTKNLLSRAAGCSSVRAFLYTSTMSVVAGDSLVNVSEDAPTLISSSRAEPYQKSKSLAEAMVLEANGKENLRTLSLRVSGVYGERDSQNIVGCLAALDSGKNKIQVGDNTNLFDFVSVTNAADAHILAAEKLLAENTPEDSSLKVDGEAFFITDGMPVPFWTFERLVWSAAGDRTPIEEVRVLPANLMIMLATIVELLYWTFSLGRKRPKQFRREYMIYASSPRTFSIEKACRRLGYNPHDDRDEQIRKGIKWAREEQKATETEQLYKERERDLPGSTVGL